jgi:hypothetical protein
VYVIGDPRLTARYAAALAARGSTAVQIDGAEAALRGLAFIYQVSRGMRA